MPFPPDLSRRIKDKLDAGQLPTDATGKMFAGHGNGKPCDGCDEPIGCSQIEYEIECGPRTYRLHLDCAGLWSAWRQKRQPPD